MSEINNPFIFHVLLGLICALVLLAHRGNAKRASQAHQKVQALEIKLKNTSIDSLIASITSDIQITEQKIEDGNKHLTKLNDKIKVADAELALINAGLVPPVFSIDDDEDFKSDIRALRKEQFELIKAKKATESATNWEWMGSRSDGRKVVDAYNYILLQAFNSEFDSIVRKMRISTISAAKSKLIKLDEQLQKLGETANCRISYKYLNAKSDELDVWAAELRNKEQKKLERKHQQKILREQAKLSKVDDDLEDEIEYRRADLEKAKKIALSKAGLDKASALLEIESLQKDIKALEKKFERSTSQAQLTRAGYIYVISNLGSFGEDVVKIGMTRRLEPMDRVNELGDASVPFKFDVHTLAFVEDAPSLEKRLHNRFDKKRVNKDNVRKEFFVVPPREVKAEMELLGIDSDWYFDVEAKEFRESKLIVEAKRKEKLRSKQLSDLPEAI